MKKRLFILSMILAMVIGCATVPKIEPASVLTSVGNGILRETHVYTSTTREYYFRHGDDVEYPKMVVDLFSIDGIQDISPAFYQFTIKIAKSYSWDEVEPHIVKILESVEDYIITKEDEKPDKSGGL